MTKPMYGPIQFTIIGFDNEDMVGGLLDEINAVRTAGVIRLIDFMFVSKDSYGDVLALEVSDLTEEERMEFGAVVGGLIGLGADGKEGAEIGAELGALAVAENDFGLLIEDLQEVINDIPVGTSAMIVLFEHAWAVPLKTAIMKNGGMLLAQGLIHPLDLVAVGAELRSAVEAEIELEQELYAEDNKKKNAKKVTSTKQVKAKKKTATKKSTVRKKPAK